MCKLLALSQVVLTPEAYGVNLNPIANEPYFEAVAINDRLDLSRVAAFANIDEDELIQLNPAFKKRMTVDGPQQLLVPTAKAQLLSDSLSNLKPEQLVSLQPNKAVFARAVAEAKAPVAARSYRVKRGDNLAPSPRPTAFRSVTSSAGTACPATACVPARCWPCAVAMGRAPPAIGLLLPASALPSTKYARATRCTWWPSVSTLRCSTSSAGTRAAGMH